MIALEDLVGFLDEHLRTQEIPDFPNACNGLQVYREGPVQRIALAVDAAQATIDQAVRLKVDLMIVHHGLLWGGVRRLVGSDYRRLRALIEANLGLYSAHLPLDVHPEHGNNAVLARELGIQIEDTFGAHDGMPIGIWGTIDMRREALAARLDEVLGSRVHLIPGGSERIRRVGIVTGGGASQIRAARQAGLDAFITGEVAHHNYFEAIEGGLNLYLGGHYATEVWGVQAIGGFLRDRFGLDCFFIDHPTGL